MSTINFSDGVSINTDGYYRVIEEIDGLYVVGNGMCIPVRDSEEAKKTIASLTSSKFDQEKQ